MQTAITIHNRLQISYCDAAIIEAAGSLDCETALSKNREDGQGCGGGAQAENPFRAA